MTNAEIVVAAILITASVTAVIALAGLFILEHFWKDN